MSVGWGGARQIRKVLKISGVIVAVLGLMLLTTAAVKPVTTDPRYDYPVSCSRSLVFVNSLTGAIAYNLYGPITSCMALDVKEFTLQVAPAGFDNIVFYLNSSGGSFTDALSIAYNLRYLKRAGTSVIIVASGQVSGAALWLFAMGDHRYIAPDTLVVFEWPYKVERTGGFFNRRPNEAQRVWLDLLARGLGIGASEVEQLLNEHAVWYGHQLIARGLAKDADQLKPELVVAPSGE